MPEPESDAGRLAVDVVVVGTTAWVYSVALASKPDGTSLVRRWESQYQDAIRQLRELPEEAQDPAAEQQRLRFGVPARPARYTDDQLAGADPLW